MSSNKKDFLEIIKKQRNKKKSDKFQGTFLDYLHVVKNDPNVVKLAHKRLYDVIATHGTSSMSELEDRCRKLFKRFFWNGNCNFKSNVVFKICCT